MSAIAWSVSGASPPVPAYVRMMRGMLPAYRDSASVSFALVARARVGDTGVDCYNANRIARGSLAIDFHWRGVHEILGINASGHSGLIGDDEREIELLASFNTG